MKNQGLSASNLRSFPVNVCIQFGERFKRIQKVGFFAKHMRFNWFNREKNGIVQ